MDQRATDGPQDFNLRDTLVFGHRSWYLSGSFPMYAPSAPLSRKWFDGGVSEAFVLVPAIHPLVAQDVPAAKSLPVREDEEPGAAACERPTRLYEVLHPLRPFSRADGPLLVILRTYPHTPLLRGESGLLI